MTNPSEQQKRVLIGIGTTITLLVLSLGVPAWYKAERGGTVDLCHFVPGQAKYKLKTKHERKAYKHLARHENDVPAGTYYVDADADGFGDALSEYFLPCPAEGYVDDNLDCDDADDLSHPGAEEFCGDQVDNDCDGEVDEDCGLSLVIEGETVTVPAGPRPLPGDLFSAGDPVLIDTTDPSATTINGNYYFQDDTYAYAKRYFVGAVASQEFRSSRTGPQGTGDAHFETLGVTLNTWDADAYGNARYANLGQVLLSGEPVTLNLFKHVTTTGAYSRRIVQLETTGRCEPLRFDMPDPAYCDLYSEDDSIHLVIEYKLEYRLNNSGNPRVAVLGIVLSENLRRYQDTLSYFESSRPEPQTRVENNGQAHDPAWFVSLDGLDPLGVNPIEVGFDVLFDSGIMLSGVLVSPLTVFGDEIFPEETHAQCLDPAGTSIWDEDPLSNAWFLSTEIQKGCYEHSADRKRFAMTQMDLQNPEQAVTINPPGPPLTPPSFYDEERRK